MNIRGVGRPARQGGKLRRRHFRNPGIGQGGQAAFQKKAARRDQQHARLMGRGNHEGSAVVACQVVRAVVQAHGDNASSLRHRHKKLCLEQMARKRHLPGIQQPAAFQQGKREAGVLPQPGLAERDGKGLAARSRGLSLQSRNADVVGVIGADKDLAGINGGRGRSMAVRHGRKAVRVDLQVRADALADQGLRERECPGHVARRICRGNFT